MTYRQPAKPQVVVWPDGRARSRMDLSLVVESFSAQKSLQGASGRFTMTLAPSLAQPYGGGGRRSYPAADPHVLERVVRPQALVSLGLDEPGGVGLFLVDEVSRSTSFAGGSVQDTLTITGQDFGKTLASDHIVYATLVETAAPGFIAALTKVVGPNHALLQNIRNVWAPKDRDGTPVFQQADIGRVTDWVLSVAPSMTIPLLEAIGGTGHLGDYITPIVTRGWNDGRIQAAAPYPMEGAYFDYLRGLLDADFYEIVVDSVPRRTIDPQSRFSEVPVVVLVIRPKPFDEPALGFLPTSESTRLSWPKLRTRVDGLTAHRIPLDQVFSANLSVTDADVFAYYRVMSEFEVTDNSTSAAQGLFNPAVDVYALKKFGLRSYQARLSLLSSDVWNRQQSDEVTTRNELFETIEFRNRLLNWYRLNAWFESGSVSVIGRDAYRVGDPVELPWRTPMRGPPGPQSGPPMRYYVGSVSTQWSFGDVYTSQLGLTRGHNAALVDHAKAEIAAEEAVYGVPSMIAATGGPPRSLLRARTPQALDRVGS